jgi:hypothetical protein
LESSSIEDTLLVLPTMHFLSSSTTRRPYAINTRSTRSSVSNTSANSSYIQQRRRRRRYLKRWPILVATLGVLTIVHLILMMETSSSSLSKSPSSSTPPTTIVNNNERRQQPQKQKERNIAVVKNSISYDTENGWKRIRQQQDYPENDTVENEDYNDDSSFLVGKSCHWIENKDTINNWISYYSGILLSYIFFASRKSFTGEWVCRDCGNPNNDIDTRTTSASASIVPPPHQHQQPQATLYSSWKDCPKISRRGKCSSFAFQGWDEPKPRSYSTYDPTSSKPYPIRILTSYGVGQIRKVEYEQPQCTGSGGNGGRGGPLSEPCFDIRRCVVQPSSSSHNDDQQQQQQQVLLDPIPIFAYPGQSKIDVQESLMTRLASTPKTADTIGDDDPLVGTVASSFILVDDPNKACLLFVHVDDVYTIQTTNLHNSWNSGKNHYVYGIKKPIISTTEDDSAFVHDGMAALGSYVLNNAQIRWGYDIPLPLPALWSYKNNPSHNNSYNNTNTSIIFDDDWHRPRKWLLSFKGSIQDTLQPYYQHRWLAAEYLYNSVNNNDDVVVDVQCRHKTLWGKLVTYADYDNTTQQHFDSLMINSTFAFCPGGSHVTSFRLSEVLSVGSIPILPPEAVTPFAPEIDWSKCIIRVSIARIIDLPRRLRNISPKEIRTRQVECQRLYRLVFFPTTPPITIPIPPAQEQQQQQLLSLKDGTNRTTTSTSASTSTNVQEEEEERIRRQHIGFLQTSMKVWLLRLRKQIYSNNDNFAAFG